MDVATIDMPVAEARAKWREYRAAVRANPQANDEILMKGFREIMHGRKVLDLSRVLPAGGVDSRNRPRLAIARADEQRIRCWSDLRGNLIFAPRDRWMRKTSNDREFSFPIQRFGMSPTVNLPDHMEALVPMVPPALRPEHGIDNYHILWEADWREAPVDPLLLKHIAGPLFAILAQWDLTDLERAVMAGSLG